MKGQTPKSWLWDYLCRFKAGTIFDVPQAIVPVIKADWDWPLPIQMNQDAAVVTAVPVTLALLIDLADSQDHAVLQTLNIAVGGATVNDFVQIFLLKPGVVTCMVRDFVIPFVNGDFVIHGPIYVPPGWTLQMLYTTAAPGGNFTVHRRFFRAPGSTPLPILSL